MKIVSKALFKEKTTAYEIVAYHAEFSKKID